MNPLTHNTLKGNWATLLLATENNGNLNIHALEEEIDVLISSSPCGIYSNGTAGEFYAQTEKEFFLISELLSLKCHAAGIPFQIGVSHTCPQISLERLKMIKHLRPCAVQLILPDWFPVTLEEAILFLKRMEEEADGIPLVLYNPPHAKKILAPAEWMTIKKEIPSLIGVKVFDQNRNAGWYQMVKETVKEIAVFIPGHHLATGLASGTHGSYSNIACLNPFAAQKWYEVIRTDPEAGLELERRIQTFMDKCITPFITHGKYPNHACDRFMALVGAWAQVGSNLRWPYRSIPQSEVESMRKEVNNIIPEFYINHTG